MSVTLATLAAFALAAPVAGAATPPTVQYGGSTSPQQDPLVITVRGSQVVRISAQYDTSCGNLGGTVAVAAGHGRLSRTGRFSLTRSVSATDAKGQVQTLTETISGTLTKSTGSGTSRVTMTGTDENGRPCTSGLQRWRVAHRPGRVFSGTTTQRFPVVMELSANGRSLNHLHVGWQAPCNTGGRIVFGDFLRSFPIVGGRFGDRWSAEFNLSDGGKELDQYSLSGIIGRLRATGSMSVRVQSIAAGGATEATCSTPTVRWSATS